MIVKSITVQNPQGLHARPASLFVKIANRFSSTVNVTKDGEKVSGKSMMGLLTLAAEQGAVIELEVSGPDEEKACEELEKILLGNTDSPGNSAP